MSFRVLGSNEDSWDLELFNKFQGVPWEPTLGREGIQLKSRVTFPEGEESGICIKSDGTHKPRQIRAMRLTKKDLDTYGTQVGCAKCEAHVRGDDANTTLHLETCRDRIEGAIKAAEPVRYAAHEEKERIKIASKFEDDGARRKDDDENKGTKEEEQLRKV